MATIVQRRRGTTAQHTAFTGALGEITIDTDKDVAVVHDGVTAGGFPLAGTMFANIFSQVQTIDLAADVPALDIKLSGVSKYTFYAGGFATGERLSLVGTLNMASLSVVSSVTGASSASASTIATVWNTTAAPTAFQIAVTDTASAATALLVDFQKGAISQFKVSKTGDVTALGGVTAANGDFTVSALGVVDVGGNLIHNVTDPVVAQDAATKNYVDTAVGGSAPPFSDATPLVEGSVDPSKLLRFEVDGFTAATTRVITPPNADITLAGINIAQTFAEDQTFGKRILLPDTISATVGGIYFGGVIAVHNFGAYNFFAGVGAGNLTMTGVRNTAVGFESGPNITSGINNCFFGYDAGYLNAAGKGNSFFGFRAGNNNAAGEYNSFFGNRSGYANDANNNSFFGSGSGSTNTSGTNNVFVGFNAGYSNLTGANNSLFGAAAGFYGSLAVNNSFFGRNAGRSAGYGGVGGSYNCFFGFHAGYANTSGSNNVFFGHQAGDNVTDGSNNLLIGFNIDAANPSGVGQLSLGNLIFGTALDGTGTTVSSGNVGIAVVAPHSGLQVGRSFALPYRAISGTDTFAATDYTIDTTSGTFTLNLPTAVGITGRIYVAKNSGAGIVTLDADGGELIDGVTTQTINPGASLTVQSTNAGWIIL